MRPGICGYHHCCSLHLLEAGLFTHRGITTDNTTDFPRKIPVLVQISPLHLAVLKRCIPAFLSVSIATSVTFQKAIIWNQLGLYMNSAFV